jgi:hypothetical protein
MKVWLHKAFESSLYTEVTAFIIHCIISNRNPVNKHTFIAGVSK